MTAGSFISATVSPPLLSWESENDTFLPGVFLKISLGSGGLRSHANVVCFLSNGRGGLHFNKILVVLVIEIRDGLSVGVSVVAVWAGVVV